MNERRVVLTAIKIIGLALFAGLATWLMVELRTLIVCLVFSLTLASAIAPVAEWGEKRKISRPIMVLAVYLAVVLTYTVIAILLTPAVKAQSKHLYEHLPMYLTGVTDWFESVKGGIAGDRGEALKVDEVLKNLALKLGHQTLDVGAGLLGLVVDALLVFFMTAYFVIEANAIWQKLLIWVPPARRPMIGALIRPVASRMGGYVRGQILVSICVSAFLSIGLSLLHVNYGLILGVLAGLLNLVPFVGSAFACVFALVVAVNQNIWLAGAVLCLFACEQWLESNFIVPYLLGRNVELHPLIVFFAILIGATLMGVPGALVAVPLASAGQFLLQEFYLKPMNARGQSGVTVSGAPCDPAAMPFSGYAVGDYCKLGQTSTKLEAESGVESSVEVVFSGPSSLAATEPERSVWPIQSDGTGV